LKVFTTNYDICFETAAADQGLVVIDGFSFAQPRHFDPRYFSFDIVRRPIEDTEAGAPLEGVFHLHKLHGSVTWSRTKDGRTEIVDKVEPQRACLIYPANGKYQQSYTQPHIELVSRFLSTLREPNTCLIVVGYGFNDDHLSEPILSAVRSNPHLRLIVVDPMATRSIKDGNNYWKSFFSLASKGEDVAFLNASFAQFADLIPDLKSLPPSERLVRDLRQVTRR